MPSNPTSSLRNIPIRTDQESGWDTSLGVPVQKADLVDSLIEVATTTLKNSVSEISRANRYMANQFRQAGVGDLVVPIVDVLEEYGAPVPVSINELSQAISPAAASVAGGAGR